MVWDQQGSAFSSGKVVTRSILSENAAGISALNGAYVEAEVAGLLARVAKSKARRRPPVKVPEPEPAPDPQPKPESEAVSEPAPVSAAAAAKELETAERELRMVRYRRASVMEMCLPPADNDEQDDGDDRRLLGDCDDGGGERGGTTAQPGVQHVEAEQQRLRVRFHIIRNARI